MGFLAAAAPALTTAAPYISAGTAIVAGRQASTVGAYNKAIADRNFRVKVQEAERIEQQKEFDLARFDQQFAQLQGKTKTAVLTSGVQLSGSGLRILRYNAEQAEIEKDILDYNSKVAELKKLEEANFARMSGDLARQQARAAQFGYYAQAGTSLLKAFG